MNTRLLASLCRQRIAAATRMNRMRQERPPCMPRIDEKRREIAGIDALIARETGRADHADH